MKNMKVRIKLNLILVLVILLVALRGYCFRQRHGRCERQSTGNDGSIVPPEL